MTIEERIKNHESLIYEIFSGLDLEKLDPLMKFKKRSEWIPSIPFCTEPKNIDVNYYEPKFCRLDIKNVLYQPLQKNLIKNKSLIDLFSNDKIGNIYLFKAWGNVLEHLDPDGLILGYPQKSYQTLLMPLTIPSEDKNVFCSYINGKSSDIFIKAKFTKLSVYTIKHSWKFDFAKCNIPFNILHIDYFSQDEN